MRSSIPSQSSWSQARRADARSTQMPDRQLKAGVVGLGLGAARIVREMDASPKFDLYAAADIDPDARERVQRVFPRTKVYDSIEGLAADPEVEAVWLSTPNRDHAPHMEI